MICVHSNATDYSRDRAKQAHRRSGAGNSSFSAEIAVLPACRNWSQGCQNKEFSFHDYGSNIRSAFNQR